TGLKRYFPFELLRSLKNEFNNSTTNDLLEWDTCEIKEISELPSSYFSVLIGHAYGAPSKAKLDDFIAPNVESFLQQNIQNIENIIFTGDVFSVPDSSKWNNLFEKFGSAKIYVAPGNHDVLRPDSKEIFFQNNLLRNDFPFDLPFGNLTVVIDDSISSNLGAGENLRVLLKKTTTEDIFVARHNIPVSQLLPYANSNAGNLGIISVDEFIQDFSKQQNFTWIMGDGGAYKHLPRLTCNSFKNHRFIVNGIGEVKNDTLLILHDGNIFSHIIK
ncbi:metallophosphoesterase, partial [Amylibacter sp.]|nr:metallophosphoesterase [Amylibacter sp.]